MTSPIIGAALAATLAGSAVAPAQEAPAAPEEVTFETEDGLTLYGWHRRPAGEPRAVVLLFHQAGASGRGEYGDVIAPRLVEEGYATLAVDLRTGGDRFDGVNRTLWRIEGRSYGYCDAYRDLEAALEEARRLHPGVPVVALGSSFSAALVLRLGADHPDDLAAIVAFSPASGGAMEGCRATGTVDGLRVPALAVRPPRETGMPSVQEQLDAFREAGVETHVAEAGTHGASTLHPERVGTSTEATWEVVLRFLDRALAGS